MKNFPHENLRKPFLKINFEKQINFLEKNFGGKNIFELSEKHEIFEVFLRGVAAIWTVSAVMTPTG